MIIISFRFKIKHNVISKNIEEIAAGLNIFLVSNSKKKKKFLIKTEITKY